MLKRRDFLRATLLTAGAIVAPACGGDERVNPLSGGSRAAEDGAAFFPQGLASGDPRPDSVILWARVEDEGAPEGDLALEVEVSTTEDFAALVELPANAVKALAKYDRCVKVRVAGLEPGTVYYYRFVYVKDGKGFLSPSGRTKTAPAAGADVPVRFAFVSCQDYIGRYYNSYVALAEEDIDFFVHLGDYVYETTGDPTFQTEGDRGVRFSDEAGAIALGDADDPYFAARTLDNYRELYKTVRSDKNLQKVHMRFPAIVTWDDHEYANDCRGATATYFAGAKDETDEARRKAANQAWFEYQPVDYPGDEAFAYDADAPYPSDITIYRDFEFGKHVHLVMTDLRTYRAERVIPQDAFPGEVVLDQAALVAELGAVPELARPYIDVEAYAGGAYKAALTELAPAAGFDAAKVTGNLSVRFINAVAARANETLPADQQIPLIDDAAAAALDRGYAYIDMGKTSFYATIGALYFVVKDVFDVVAKVKYQASGGASEDVMGKDQEAWFLDTMKASKATWKVWGNEYCLSQLAVDLAPYPIPADFQRRFYINVEDWNGCRNKARALLAELADVGGVVAITGDIHGCFAGTPPADDAGTKKIVEFVGTSISSGTLKAELKGQIAKDPVLSQVSGASLLAGMVDSILTATGTRTNPFLAVANSGVNGYAVVTASGDELAVTMKLLPEAEVTTDHSADPAALASLFQELKLRTLPGGSDLYKDDKGAWKRWDPATMAWV